ncbi:MAG: protein tyrosine phosphatase [Candidatus Saccharibacteria bacterium]|nr:protein tyrosine phosphatase [Candidatus Saccharibacteria bacterium]
MTKILFVCRGNVGRSQAASALYNSLHPSGSDSAGTNPIHPELTVGEISKSKNIVTVLKELGLDISNNARQLVTPELVESYDKVINMAEPETVPAFLINNPKVEVWDIEDPAYMDVDDTRKIRDQIFAKVKDLATT